jgi:hypothetical protein
VLRGPILLYVLCLTPAACSTKAALDADAGQPDGASGRDASNDAGTSRDANQAADSNGADGGAGDATLQEGGNGFAFAGCPLFAPGYAYNVDVSSLTPDPTSASTIANLTSLAPDIAAEFPGGEYYNVVPASQPDVAVGTASYYGFDPDGGFFYEGADASAVAPIPPNVVYENAGTPNADHHMMVLQQGACLLYELYAPNPSSATTGWSNLVLWNLSGSPEIPASYDIGSTTQAGTPLLPGVIWPSEIATGEIHHAIDIVMADNAIMPCAFVPPASTVRYSGAPAGQGIPYGARLRLKSTFDTSGFTGTQALVVVRALQRYGMIPTDASGESRSVFRLGQDTDGGTLDQTDMNQLDALTWSDFDVMPLGTVTHPSGCP